MKVFDATKVKASQVDLDDVIIFENRKVELTHYVDDIPQFLQFVDGDSRPFYCIGFKNAIQWLKTGKLENPKSKIKTSKATLNGKKLIVKTEVTPRGVVNTSINFDGQDLEMWEFKTILFPDVKFLNLFDVWTPYIFDLAYFQGLPAEKYKQLQQHKFPSPFDNTHWNVAQHIVDRVKIVSDFLANLLY